MPRAFCAVLLIVCATLSAFAGAESAKSEPLPSPLTLQAALALAEQPHPDLEQQMAQISILRAEMDAVQADYGLTAYIDVIPRWVDPATEAGHDLVNDSRARLSLYKKLYDFGRTRALRESAAAAWRAEQFILLDVRQRRRLEIMSRFLDVILADLRVLADEEEMARRFVRFDKARDERALGIVSDVQVLELESAYREALNRRTQTVAEQRYTRISLAIALNRPNELPRELDRPMFDALERETPEFDAIVKDALAGNPQVTALRAQLEAAEDYALAESALRRPVLSAESELTYLEREIGSRDEAVIGLRMRFPLYQGGIDRAAIARAQAERQRRHAQLRKAELVLRQRLLQLLQRLDVLRVERTTARVREDYRDLAVEEARGLYEMEVRTNLGESMARLTEAQWQAAKVEFETVLTWARLEALLGKLVPGLDGEKM